MMEKKAFSYLMTKRGWLLRGDAVVASTGLVLAFLMLSVLAVGAWWIVRNERTAAEAQHKNQTAAVGSLLAHSIETLLIADELSAVRRIISETGRANQYSICRVVLSDGQIIADVDASKINVHRLPQQWNIASESTDPNTWTFPLTIDGRGQASLEIGAPPLAIAWRGWEAHAGVGAFGSCCMLVLFMSYRRLRSRMRAITSIREALLSKHAGEQSIDALAVNAEKDSAEAMAWNAMLAENRSLREQLVLQQGDDRRGSSSGAIGDLESVCDAMWQGLLLVDENLRITYANGAAAILLRAKHEGMLGSDITSLSMDDSLVEPIRKVVDGTLRRRVTTEIKLEHEAVPQLPSDGQPASPVASILPCSILRFNVRPVRRGDTAAAMVIIEDITQQRMAEEARNSFVAQATHELRMPLTNIRLYSESALEEGEKDVVLRSRCLNVINQESKRLERIVGDMLSVAEIEAGTLKLRPGDVRLDTLFEELHNDYRAPAEEKGVTLTFNLPPKLPAIKGDRDKIVLALHNLIGNAIKYTPKGGSVDVNVEITDKQLLIDVTDTGIGIRTEETELIFQKFYRSKDERIADITGSGLGLAVAREVIRMHRGDITVRSLLNEGSTFTLAVPTYLEAA